MLRITELKLPLDHAPEALPAAIYERLGIAPQDLLSFEIARRANDARKKSAILLIYSVDVVLKDEAAVLERLAGDPSVRPTPDTEYRFIGHAPAVSQKRRPVVIGAGPCGLFAALILAQMGLKPIILERGKVVRERTKDTWGLWRRSELNPESNVQFGEGRQALQPGQGPAPSRPQGTYRVRQGRSAARDTHRGPSAYRHLPAGLDGRTYAANH